MAKVEGPLFSLRARGSIEETLTFQTTKAGQIVKFYKVPTDPKTVDQMKSRDDFKKAAAYYRNLSVKDRLAWKEMTYDEQYTGYAGFIKSCKSELAKDKNWVNINKVTVLNITHITAEIKCEVDQAVGVVVKYGYIPGQLYMQQIEQEPYTENPIINLSNLYLRTKYYFRIFLIDNNINFAETGLYSFETIGN